MDRLPPFDKIGATPVPDFVNADPTNGIPGSIVNGAVFNALQREIVNAIIGAGLTPSTTDLTQLAQAISKLAATQTQSGKSAFNTQTFTTSTRVSLSGTTGVVPVWSPGTYTKKSATSILRVTLLTTFFSPTGNGPSQANLAIGATTKSFFASCGTSQNPALGQIPFVTVLAGLPAGAQSISFSVQRNDGISWTASFCPTQAADNSQLPVTNPSVIIVEEIEP